MRYTALAALRTVGLEVYRAPGRILIDFLQSRGVDCVLDVGAKCRANLAHGCATTAMAAGSSRSSPFPRPIRCLAVLAGDGLWEARQFAIGDAGGSAVINVGANSALSSFLTATEVEVVTPDDARSFKEGSETVDVRTLDDFAAELSGNLFLKSDTQGFERNVLEGAKDLDAPVVRRAARVADCASLSWHLDVGAGPRLHARKWFRRQSDPSLQTSSIAIKCRCWRWTQYFVDWTLHPGLINDDCLCFRFRSEFNSTGAAHAQAEIGIRSCRQPQWVPSDRVRLLRSLINS